MKRILNLVPVFALFFVLASCSSVKVATDYDKSASFNEYKTFAFFKTGIDKAEINDIDKKRILRAIEAEMLAKGFTKSEDPDLLISIFTKSRENINIYNNNMGPWGWGFGYRWGWTPWMWNQQSVSRSTEGTLFIDLIDAEKKELIWQGMGRGYLTQNMNKKDERTKKFVMEIMEEYPPQMIQ